MTNKFTTIYIALVITATILATYFVTFSIQHPYIGALVEYQNDQYVVVETEPNTWSSRNLKVGQIVVSVNGNPPGELLPITRWGALEQAKEITVKDAKTGTIEGYIPTSEIDTQMVFQIIVPVIVFLLSLYCSYFIYQSRDESTKSSSVLLILFLLDISLAYISGGASARGETIARSTVTLYFVLVPIFYLHFIYHYFKELNKIWFSKRWLDVAYFLAFINTLINALVFSDLTPFGINVLHAKALNLASFMFLFLLAFGMILIGMKKVTYKAQVYLIKAMVFMDILAFLPFILLYVFPYIVLQKQIVSPVFLASFILIIPFSLVYQFLAKKIYDIEFIVSRVRYYTFLSVIPSLVGTLLIIYTKSENATIYSIRGFLIILLMMIAGFYLKEIMDFKFNLKRISEKKNYQDKIFEFTNTIRSANEFDEVIDEFKRLVLETMIISDVYVIELNKDNTLNSISPQNEDVYHEYFDCILKSSKEIGYVFEVDKGFVVNIGETQRKNYIVVALEKINTPKLTRDELAFLKALAHYTNVTTESFLKIEQFIGHLEELEEQGRKSTWLNRVLYQLEEKQRSLLAKDLHDSVLQDLVSIKRKFELNGYMEEQAPDASLNHDLILYDLNKVISMTRETCHELRPNILYDLGLERAIKKLVEQHIHANGYNIRFTSNRIEQDIEDEIQLNLYRITQELLNNTKKHSNAKNIVLMLVRIKEKIVLHYEDDGNGTDPETLFGNTGSMGLSGIRERVTMLDGTINVTTGKGKGFKVLIEI